jgi:hypothetical protein
MQLSSATQVFVVGVSLLAPLTADARQKQCGASSDSGPISAWWDGKKDAKHLFDYLKALSGDRNQYKSEWFDPKDTSAKDNFFNNIDDEYLQYRIRVLSAAYVTGDPDCQVCGLVDGYRSLTNVASNCATAIASAGASDVFSDKYGPTKDTFSCELFVDSNLQNNLKFGVADVTYKPDGYTGNFWSDMEGRTSDLVNDIKQRRRSNFENDVDTFTSNVNKFTHTDDGGQLAGQIKNVGGPLLSCDSNDKDWKGIPTSLQSIPTSLQSTRRKQ